jgi:hypothetical protein
MSTDPAKISDIEQRAQDLQARQASQPAMPMHQSTTHHKKSAKHPKAGE